MPGLFDARTLGYVPCVASRQLVSPEFAPPARQALVNLRRAREPAGARAQDITAVTVYLTDMAQPRTFGAITQEVLGTSRRRARRWRSRPSSCRACRSRSR